MKHKLVKQIFISFATLTILSQSLSSYLVLSPQQAYAEKKTEITTATITPTPIQSDPTLSPSVTPSTTATPTVSPTPTVDLSPTTTVSPTVSPTPTVDLSPTPTASPTVSPTPTQAQSGPTPTVVQPTVSANSIQSAILTASTATIGSNVPLSPGATYNVPSGQKVLIVGDVTIDGTNYFDDNGSTIAVDVITDGNTHTVFAKYGASIFVFTSTATAQNIQDTYNNAVNDVNNSGNTVDPTSLNQLVPPPALFTFVTVGAGGTYNVPAGQRVMVTADVKIDGVTHYDGSASTIAVDVLVDGKSHTILFPFGGAVRVFTQAATTQFIQTTYDATVKSITDSGKTLDSKSLNQLSTATPPTSNEVSVQPGATYNVPSGQKVLIVGDVTIDGTNYFDDNGSTIAVDVITDGNTHTVFAKYGASIFVFTSTATAQNIQDTYNNAVNDVNNSGNTVDPTSLNQLVPPPALFTFVTVGAGGTYNVPAGQRVMVTADVKIDGVTHYDGSASTIAVDVLVDGKSHTILFPFGGAVRVFTQAATTQFIQTTYDATVKSITDSGKTLDSKSLNQLSTATPPTSNEVSVQPGATYNVPSGQKVLIVGDVTIDGTNYFDDNGSTIAVDVITDGNTHTVFAKYGASIFVFTSTATAQNIQDTYNNAVNDVNNSGNTVDPTSLNQLVPPPALFTFVTVGAGGTYNVPAGQRVMVTADVKIDGVTHYDGSASTIAVDVLVDGKSHTILFPFGGAVRVFTQAATTQFIQTTYDATVKSITDSGKTLDSKSLNQLSTATPPTSNEVSVQPGATYNVPSGQKVLIVGDVTIDGTNYFDDNGSTIAVDVITDGNTHTVFAKYGASIFVFTSTATAQNIQDTYNNAVNDVNNSGNTVDPTSLNQLVPPPALFTFVTVGAGGTYNVPAGQRVMVTADVKIDGVTHYDGSASTIAVDVLVDGKSHTILFPFGGAVRVFTQAATTQFIQTTYDATVKSITDSGSRLDLLSLNQL